ncbi:MAG: MiaB/RimO family radical SAM methylthiotransferase [Spirochaetales bacterium]
MKYCLIQLGCQMNISDGERIRTVLEQMGFERTEQEGEADLLGIVACSVRQKAIDKVYSRIAKWNSWKNNRNLLTFVSGCILPADRERFLGLFDLMFAINDLPQLPDMIRQYGVVTPFSLRGSDEEFQVDVSQVNRSHGGSERQEAHVDGDETTESGHRKADGGLDGGSSSKVGATLSSESLRSAKPKRRFAVMPQKPAEDRSTEYWKIRPSYTSGFEAFVPIQNGCDKFCTFCAVPHTRGREVSRPSSEILAEVRFLVEHDYKAITLLGQNVNSYGLDRKGTELSFADLLRAVGEIGRETGKEFWTYFTSPHPRDMTDEVIDTIAEYPVLAKQIHLPIQSGDDKVLIRMNRNHSVVRYRHIVEKIRKTIPSATIFTDIIVGFSGETEEQFENTRAAMREFGYNMAYVAMYSPRPGAASSRWPDDVPQETKKERLQILSDELKTYSYRYNRALIGRTLRVLVEKPDKKPGFLSGKTEGRITIRFAGDDASLIGRFVDVRITDCAALSLEGELVRTPEPITV